MTSRHHRGPLFRNLIAEIVRKKAARSYLEIGVRDGSTLQMVACPVIGVDPNFNMKDFSFSGKTEVHLFQKSSDEFFRDHNPCQVLGRTMDVVFLDGLHLLEYLLRDFINCERFCARESLIIIDDCLPVNCEMTERYHCPEARQDKETAGWWTGDVWKIIPLLKQWRPDLQVSAVDTAPTGSLFITNLDPKSEILQNSYFQIVEQAALIEFDIEKFYSSIEIIAAATISNGFDFSIYAGW